MPIGIPKPSGKSVRDLHARLEREWRPRFRLDEEFRDLVHQRNKIEVLEESDDLNMEPMEVHSGRAGGIIEHAGGLLMARPTFHADPPTLNTADERTAEQVERAAANVFEQELVKNNFWPAVGRDILIYGRAFVKSMLAMSQWTAEQGYPVRDSKESDKAYLKRVRNWKETEGKFPFVISHIPALSILPMLDSRDNVLATVEIKYATAKILADDFGSETVKDLLSRRMIKWYDELPIIEYIDTEWVSYLLAGTDPRDRSVDEGVATDVTPLYSGHAAYTPLRTWKHNLGKHPVVLIPGIRTELSDYRSHFKGFLSDAKDALHTYDFLLSRLATMVNAYYLPSYEWKLGATSAQFAGRDRPVLRVNLGGVTVTYADENLDVLAIPQGLPDATMLLSQADDIIQRHTLEDVLFGRVQGAAPAYQVNLRINVAKSKLSPLAQNMAIGVTMVMELFLRSIIQLREAVVIGGEKITVAMAKQYLGRLSTSIDPKSPVDRSQDIGTANLALQFGLPWDWIVENILDIEDPATLRLMKDIQELEELPPVKERLMQDALEQLEALIEEDEMEELTGEGQAGLPPEFAQAAAQLLEDGGGEEAGQTGAPPGAPNAPAAPGLGQGPFPPGAAPQTVAPRGLGTPNAQPAAGGGGPVGEEL